MEMKDIEKMVEANKNNFGMVDNAAGVCAGMAAYKYAQEKLRMVYYANGGIVRTGCSLLSAYAGIQIGSLVRDKVRKIRQGLTLSMVEKQEEE